MAHMIKSACKYLSSLESINPLPFHQSYLAEWKANQEDISDFGEKEDSILEAILNFREDLYRQSFTCDTKGPPITGWEWLLTVEQMAQRTEEWYLQKARLLTASEIAAIWRGVKSRNSLILSKINPQATSKRLATLKSETLPMDWGVRYEPVVKSIIEKIIGCKIQELGRIYHRHIQGLAASPDGLIIEGPADYIGSLVEIKCPTTRPITEEIPFDYWCQMQIQMEVCDIPRCEYVEVKIKEGLSTEANANANANANAEHTGWVSLDVHKGTDEMRYQYHTGIPSEDPAWITIETYPWYLTQIRRTTVHRDTEWFRISKDDITSFWEDVDAVKAGTLIIQGPKKRVKAEISEIPDMPMFQAED